MISGQRITLILGLFLFLCGGVWDVSGEAQADQGVPPDQILLEVISSTT